MSRNSLFRGIFLPILVLIGLFTSCKQQNNESTKDHSNEKKIGVLLVNHGSRSDAWRASLLELEANVKSKIMESGDIKEVKTAFMEYTEPSIATRMKEFDKDGFTDVIIVPIFLTVSSHSFDDIPTLLGQKDNPSSIEEFKMENMERYTPKAKVHITPLLDFTDILKKNILRRYLELSKNPKEEGLVLIAYGDKTYNTEWTHLMDQVGEYVEQNAGIDSYNYGWCGHIAHYSPDSTAVPVSNMLKKKEKAVVVPVLVAFDEMFQGRIIRDGVKKADKTATRVYYKPDAILPDKKVENWVIDITKEYLNKVK